MKVYIINYMNKKYLRKIIQKTGFDFHKYYPTPNKLNWLKDRKIRIVLDVGANVGQFVKEIRETLPNAFIYSFEPLAECFSKLNENLKGDKNFKAFNFALGEKDEEVTMNHSVYSPSSSILEMAKAHKDLFPHTKEATPEKITIKRFDDIKNLNLEKEILLKIDTQGYEDRVLRGMPETLKGVKIIIIETSFVELYEGQKLFDGMYEMLKDLGFCYKGALQQKINNKTGEVVSEDSIFERK
jgi:FkbM family methyltransferase